MIEAVQIRLVSLSGMSAAVDSFGHPGEIEQNRRNEHCDINGFKRGKVMNFPAHRFQLAKITIVSLPL